MRKIHLFHCNKIATVDDEDFEYLNQFKWYLHKKGYAVRTIPLSGSKKVLMHREIMERKLGRILPSDEVVDHKNEKVIWNIRSNLRLVSNSDNLHNINHRYNHNRSGYRGVSKHKATGKWRARLHVNNHEYCTYHEARADASKAYKQMLQQYYPTL